jgi:hypothetical protein
VARRDDDFVAFVDARSAALLRTARLLTAGDQHAAEDLVQTALEKAHVACAVWESDDSFLIPVADRSAEEGGQWSDYDESVQVVRCDVSIVTCERAVDVVQNRVVLESMSSTAFRFATS